MHRSKGTCLEDNTRRGFRPSSSNNLFEGYLANFHHVSPARNRFIYDVASGTPLNRTRAAHEMSLGQAFSPTRNEISIHQHVKLPILRWRCHELLTHRFLTSTAQKRCSPGNGKRKRYTPSRVRHADVRQKKTTLSLKSGLSARISSILVISASPGRKTKMAPAHHHTPPDGRRVSDASRGNHSGDRNSRGRVL